MCLVTVRSPRKSNLVSIMSFWLPVRDSLTTRKNYTWNPSRSRRNMSCSSHWQTSPPLYSSRISSTTSTRDELVKLLNENPNVTIELSAHTDCRGSDQYNERLSQQRAQNVVNYLIQHGIEKERLTPKGYGESKPKRIKRKVAEKYPFLKEGGILDETFISTLPEEQQEQCHQLNRRTEFIVLRTTYGLFDKAGKLSR